VSRPRRPLDSWRDVQGAADDLGCTGRAAAETALALHEADKAGPGNCYAAVSDVLKALAFAAQAAVAARDEAALCELADLANEWANAQRLTLAAANN